jgi:TRAP-type C4-dicarboxylate transport system permease small subunit
MKPDRLRAIRDGLHAVIRVVAWIAAASLVIIILTTVIHVVGRYLFKSPLTGSIELIQLLLVVTVSFSIAYTEVTKMHVSFHELVDRFPRRAHAVVFSIVYFVGAAYFIVLSWREVVQGISFLMPIIGDTDVLHIPIAPFYFVIAIGALLLGIEMLLNCFSPKPLENSLKTGEK